MFLQQNTHHECKTPYLGNPPTPLTKTPKGKWNWMKIKGSGIQLMPNSCLPRAEMAKKYIWQLQKILTYETNFIVIF